jgi:protein-L-isoaspartate(D-aspartate) O-methyltransferase
MTDFKAARTNMVDCQIHPAGVISPAILNAFLTLPREKFVPANVQSVAYTDETVPVGQGRFLLEPSTHARMIQAAALTPETRVLDIGGTTGYSAAILASMAKEVVALEEKGEFLKKAEGLWSGLDIDNVLGTTGPLTQGAPSHIPFDLIFMNGSVAEIPENLMQQLTAGGQLITIIRKKGEVMGQVTLVGKTGNSFSSYPLFESGSPYLPGFEPKTAFQF